MCYFHISYLIFTTTSLENDMPGVRSDSVSQMACHHVTAKFRIEIHFPLFYDHSHSVVTGVRFHSFLFC